MSESFIGNRMAGRRLQFTPETPRGNVPLQPASASPAIDERTLITAMNRLSRQMTQFSTEVNQQLARVRNDLATCNERLSRLESQASCSEERQRKRRQKNPKIAVRLTENAKNHAATIHDKGKNNKLSES
ncbi:hypothetical protein GOODEAATRI_011533 [Goodea atripinnis]|uniref:Uncharacterized protein n=1 Tax=Goodea atripinnis TaxID=208336 RepID=A0ABV0N9T5_9TELE